jgi:hypothetical protein
MDIIMLILVYYLIGVAGSCFYCVFENIAITKVKAEILICSIGGISTFFVVIILIVCKHVFYKNKP